jgi:hypothetical protein
MQARRFVPFLSILVSFTAAGAACSSTEDGSPSSADASDDGAAADTDGGAAGDDASPAVDGASKDASATDAANDTSPPKDSGPKPQVCVAGTQGSCSGAPLQWNAATGMCCLDAPATCKTTVAQADCNSVAMIGRAEYWTGSACCVQQEILTCAPNSDKAYCTLSGTHAWPPECCINGKYTCAPGTFASCNSNNFNGSNAIYTGPDCCIAGNWTCTAKGAGACPTGTSSSGTSCCTKI